MVKSKKMSKTSIAVIVLALLLVLSLVMGMTGAWFTNSKSSSTSDKTYNFKMDTYFTLTAAATGDSSIVVTRTEYDNTVTTLTLVDPDNPAEVDGDEYYLVLPGDKIAMSATKSLSISAAGAHDDFWYVYKVTGATAVDAQGNHIADANWKNAGDANTNSKYEAYHGTNATVLDVYTIVSELTHANITHLTDGNYEISRGLTTAAENEIFSITVAGVSIEVRTMQAQNIDAEAAYEYLTGASFATDNVRN